jgi:hypothetical protein
MPDRRIDLKNPWVAGVLAFLIPGAGHFYQGRTFKGLVYSVCILGTFTCGMVLGAGQVVHFRWDAQVRSWGYLAQVWVGLPALPALIQSRRTDPLADTQTSLDAPITDEFQGSLLGDGTEVGSLQGTIELEPTDFGPRGVFRGTLTPAAGPPQELELGLGGRMEIDREILAGPERYLAISVSEVRTPGIVRRSDADVIKGYIPRSFWNRFEAPPGDPQLKMAHRQLGKFYELAAVFTWIAGLLNILAIWDAIEGPAYGYGDETEEGDRQKPDRAKDGRNPEPAQPVAAAAVSEAPDHATT